MEKSDKKIAIIDYRLGNLFSVKHMCKHLGYDAVITSDKDVLMQSDYAILPGVGAFGDAMTTLKKSDLISPIHDFIQSGKPFMGVCLGLQLLFSESDEFGSNKGLNVIEGSTRKFPSKDTNGNILKVPQIEWNTIEIADHEKAEKSPLKNRKTGDFMYFVHSFFVVPEKRDHLLTTTTYGGLTYCSSIIKDNLFACQFHPEKSGQLGIDIYRNFLNQ